MSDDEWRSRKATGNPLISYRWRATAVQTLIHSFNTEWRHKLQLTFCMLPLSIMEWPIFEHDAVVRAVVQNDDGIQVDGVGLDLTTLIDTRQFVERS